MPTKPLGEILVEKHIITQAQLDKALAEQKKNSGKRLGHILQDMEFINDKTLLSVLGQQLNCPTIDLNDVIIDGDVVNLVPEDMCRRYRLMPVLKENGVLVVAMVDPLNFQAISDVKFLVHQDVKAALATEKSLEKSIKEYYGLPDAMQDIVKQLGRDKLEEITEEKIDMTKLQEMADDAPVIKIVNHIILQAVTEKATDIHVEPFEKHLRIRYRRDGVLHEVTAPPLGLHAAIISRIKIMSGMDIAETRLPQDGRISKRIEGREIDFRVSTVPTQFGERAVLRILDRTTNVLELEKLGMEGENLKKFERMIQRPHGIVLVSGPTGSGKTTTLYASLNRINDVNDNILTIEEPIEYNLEGIGQVQVNEEIGLTFGRALRHFLRQDPDVILVGEMRDFETADIAIRSSLTGHLVFSTIHTNDAPSSITRLIDMGVEPFLINSSVIMVMAQRLVRKLCEHCKKPYHPSAVQLEELGLIKKGEKKNMEFYDIKGCEFCDHTGYAGRIALFEIMIMTDEIRDLVMQKAPAHMLRNVARKQGMTLLIEHGLDLVKRGITSLDEVLRVAIAEKET